MGFGSDPRSGSQLQQQVTAGPAPVYRPVRLQTLITILLRGIFSLQSARRLIKYSQRQKIANPNITPVPIMRAKSPPRMFAKLGRSSRL